MKSVVRPFESNDLEGVNALRIQAYPGFPETREVEYYTAAYDWFGRHPLGGEMRRWVAVADGRVVGHLAATPQHYRIKGQRVVAHTPADYEVLPQYGFQAISLMRKFFRATENCVACDMVPAVIGVETRLGAEVAGQLRYAVKLLNVSRLPAPSLPAPARRLLNLRDRGEPARGYTTGQSGTPREAEEPAAAPPTRPRAPLPAPVKGLLNGGLRTIDGALSAAFGGGGLKVEVLESFDESFDELFEKAASAVPCVPEKDSAFLRWRYGPDSPQPPATVLGVKGGETLLGYAVLLTTSTGQDGYILDLTTIPGRRDVARALLRETVRHFWRAGVQIIRYRFLESPDSPPTEDLWRLGFFLRNTRRNTLLAKFADPSLHEAAQDAANWSYNIGDGEATFWTR